MNQETVDRSQVFTEYMRRIEAIADDCDWVTHIGPETLVDTVISIIEEEYDMSKKTNHSLNNTTMKPMENNKIIYYRSPEDLYGEAISYTIFKEDGTIWVGNDEYETQVNYCPMTGEQAKKMMTGTEKQFSDTKQYYTSYE